MDSLPSTKLRFFLFSFIFFARSSSGSFVCDVKQKDSNRHRKELIQTTQHDFTNPPFTTTPVTNPVTTPSSSAPPIITVPSADPPPIPPTVDPVTNPVTTPSTSTFPPYPNTSPDLGQSWCVARGGVPESVIQVALDYACGIGGADCSPIQQGQSCYNPNSLQNHASYAFNSYFQKNPLQTSCDFGGAAMITNLNPSSGSCIFTTRSSSSASPATMSPTTTTPMPTPAIDGPPAAAAGSSGTPPTVLNASNPALGGGATGFGEIPPTTAATSSDAVKPFVSCIAAAVSIVIWTLLYI